MTLEEDIFFSIRLEEDLRESIDHGILVSNLAYLLAKTLGEPEEFCYVMSKAGFVHDIGKLKLLEYLYGRKKDSLAIEEIQYIRMHPTIGYDILLEQGYEDEIATIVLHHHENYDGSGYPMNLKENMIPYGSRILRICDVFAALISNRRYRRAFDISTSIELMIEEVKNFDMQIFLSFLQLVNSKEIEPIINYVIEINESYKLV